MLISLVLNLVTERPGNLPSFVGRANYAATLHRLSALDPALTRRIHDDEGAKPLTCSNLFEVRTTRNGISLQAGDRCAVRITGLEPLVSQALDAAFLRQPPATWEVAGHTFTVTSVSCDPTQHPWSRQTTYEGLAATRLLAGRDPGRQLTLDFVSPTAFKSSGMHVPLPLPALVFGSLVDRWNHFSPVALDPELRRFGEEVVAVSRYRLESRVVEQKEGALRIGGIGRVTYNALGGDRYWLSVFQLLGDYALYSGIGIQSATGMGQAHRVDQQHA